MSAYAPAKRTYSTTFTFGILFFSWLVFGTHLDAVGGIASVPKMNLIKLK